MRRTDEALVSSLYPFTLGSDIVIGRAGCSSIDSLLVVLENAFNHPLALSSHFRSPVRRTHTVSSC